MKESRGWRTIKGRRYAQFRTGGQRRESIALSGVKTDAEADERVALIRKVASQLVDGGRPDKVKKFADQLGAATYQKKIDAVLRGVAHVLETENVAPKALTFKVFAERYTNGDVHRAFPDHVKLKDYRDDISRLKTYVYDLIGDIPIQKLTEEDCARVMREIPRERSSSTRRHVAQIMLRILTIARYPAKVIDANPLPKGWLPSLGKGKAKPYLFPKEEALLMACTEIPLERRLIYGVLAREGLRSGELVGNKDQKQEPVEWMNVDVIEGLFTLDENKTDDPRAWVMDPGVKRALKKWKAMQPHATDRSPVFPTRFPKLAARLRADLARANVTRPQLFERSAARSWVKAHHLRATFITLSLANGRTETWVQDRTGHTSSIMINRYRQAARTAAELKLGPLLPLDEAIPEFRDAKATRGADTKAKRARAGGGEKVVKPIGKTEADPEAAQ